jgi:putative DNA primase/helicase
MVAQQSPPEGIPPQGLIELPQWVAWKMELGKDGRPTKVPYNARTGAKASSTNPQTWADYRMAARRAQTPGYSGVGFVVSPDDPYTGIDLDHCRDAETGEIEDWAQEIISELSSYTEVSPSGTGVRIFVHAVLPDGKRRTGRIEMYDSARFFTVTGRHLEDTPQTIESRQAAIVRLYRRVFPDQEEQKPQKRAPKPQASEPTRLDDAAIVRKAREADNGAKFAALWSGDTSAYDDDESRADMALVAILAFWTQDADQLDRLFRASGLMREKWGEREDYRERTIAAALALTSETYYTLPQKVRPIRPDAAKPARDFTEPITDGTAALADPPPDIGALLLQGEADDNGNAEAMWRLFGREFLFTPAIGWLRWAGTHWGEVPEPIVTQRAITTLKRRRHAAVDADREHIIKATKQDKTRVTGCRDLFKSYVIEPDVAAFDADPDVLNCQNGVLDLRTGVLTAHSSKQRFTYCLGVAWDESADMAPWTTFLLGALGGDQEAADYFQLCAGYSLTGHTREEKMFYLYGPTRAGKGAATETLLELLPRPLSAEVDFATFTAKRDNDSQNFDLADLKPARLVVASESTRTQALNTAKVKQLTGGNWTRCAFKHRDMFTYRPQYKVWLVSNWEVKADADDDAAWGRVQVFTFPHSHLGAEDMTLKDKMKSPEVLRGVLRWAVEGAMRWYTLGRLTPPESVTQATEAQRGDQDYIKQWIDDCCTLDVTCWAQSTVLMRSYLAWCETNNVHPRGAADLADTLVRRFECVAKRQAGTGLRGFKGIELRGVTL